MASHPIVHIEIPANDTKAAGEFYSKLFDWKMELDPQFDYLQFAPEGGPGGGFVKIGDPQGMQLGPSNLLVYVGTDDIEGTLRKAESLGAKTILPKTEIPMTGWFAVFTDPSGVCSWQAGTSGVVNAHAGRLTRRSRSPKLAPYALVNWE